MKGRAADLPTESTLCSRISGLFVTGGGGRGATLSPEDRDVGLWTSQLMTHEPKPGAQNPEIMHTGRAREQQGRWRKYSAQRRTSAQTGHLRGSHQAPWSPTVSGPSGPQGNPAVLRVGAPGDWEPVVPAGQGPPSLLSPDFHDHQKRWSFPIYLKISHRIQKESITLPHP